jgi:FMN phosphatase YigB (HAD superfamily)
MHRTRAVFFDVANTLLGKPGLYPAMRAVLEAGGIDVPEKVLLQRHRLLSEAIVFPDRTSRAFYDGFNAQLLRSLGAAADDGLLDALYHACSYLPWEPFADVAHLAELEHPIGILSNWDRSLTDKLTLLPGLAFRWVLGSEAHQVRKPDPAFFARMIDAAGCAAGEIVFVGDSVHLDVEPALRLGVRAYLLDRDDLYPHATLPRLRSLAQLGGVL